MAKPIKPPAPAPPKPGPEKVEQVVKKAAVKDSSHDSDIAKHPKFAKFNSHGGK